MTKPRNWRSIPSPNSQIKATFIAEHRKSGWSDLVVTTQAGLDTSVISRWLTNPTKHIELETAAALLSVYGYEIIARKKEPENGK